MSKKKEPNKIALEICKDWEDSNKYPNSKTDIEVWFWELLRRNEEFQEQFNRIKYGTKIKFDIRAIIEGDFEKKPAFGQVWIERSLHLNIEEYRDEVDERKRLMKEIVRSLYDDSFDKQGEEDIEGYHE